MKRAIIFGIGLVVLVAFLLSPFGLQGQLSGMMPQSIGPNNFLGQWYNTAQSWNETLYGFQVSQNQGTYTVDVFQVGVYQRGFWEHEDIVDWGTTILTVNAPNAHAFYTFQSGSADLQFQLLSPTSMQVRESFQIQGFGGVQTVVRTEHFALASATTTSSIGTFLNQGDCLLNFLTAL